MIIFAEKHFSQKNAKLFSFLINAAIYFRATLAISMRFIWHAVLPLVDFSILLIGLYALTNQWRISNIDFPESIVNISLPAYTLIWMLSVLFQNGYDNTVKLSNYFKSTLIGTMTILIVYALLPKSWQFSRLYILLGAGWVLSYFLLSRIFLHFSIGKKFNLSPKKNKRFAIVGGQEEFERVAEILKQTTRKIESIEHVSAGEEKEKGAVGTLNQLDQILHIKGINEIIFCAKDTTAQTIINWMTVIDSTKIDFKIAQPDSLSLIGSNSIETAGDLYVLDINSITKTENIRSKRTFDIAMGFLLLVGSPVLIWYIKNKKLFLQNIFSVLIGKLSLVGYFKLDSKVSNQLPRIKPGILNPIDSLSFPDVSLTEKLNLIYARDYSIGKDLSILLKAWKKLDR
jgi:hypothetical protein